MPNVKPFFDRFKDPKFIGMLLVPALSALTLWLNGQVDGKTAIASTLSGLVSGLFGIAQPQPVSMQKPPV